jgi:CheY-like chemotaxis protein
MLERLGFRVTAHTSPIEALEEFRSRPLQFDAVVTDIAMDGMSGIDLAREMLAIRPDVPIVLTSGYLQPEALDAARALGIKDVVLKPNTVHELGTLLSRILGGRGARPREDPNGPAPVVGT